MAAPGSPIITDVEGGGQYLQAPIYDAEQSKIPALLQQAGGAKLANPTQGFDPYEQYARRMFSQEIVPGIAERFTAGNNRANSAFQGALGQAGSDLAARLGVARANYGLQNEQMGAQFLNQAMTPLYNQAYERPYSATGQIGANITEQLPALLSAYASAPGSSALEKLNYVLSGGKAVADTVKSVTGGASGTPSTAGVADAAKTAVDAVAAGKATTDVAKSGATTTAPSVVKGAAATTAGGAAATGGALSTAGKGALASGLKTAGAVTMPVVVGGLGLWILGTIIKSLYEDFTETGDYAPGKSKGV